jgi:hypothetical protein
MDISDILQGLGSLPSNHDPFAEDLDDPFSADREQHSGQADLQALTRAWVNERGTGELLLYDDPFCLFSKKLYDEELICTYSTVGPKTV